MENDKGQTVARNDETVAGSWNSGGAQEVV